MNNLQAINRLILCCSNLKQASAQGFRPACAEKDPLDPFPGDSATVFQWIRFLPGTISHPASSFTIELVIQGGRITSKSAQQPARKGLLAASYTLQYAL